VITTMHEHYALSRLYGVDPPDAYVMGANPDFQGVFWPPRIWSRMAAH
jgi:hypothetical protein